jgi:hypothetical protein
MGSEYSAVRAPLGPACTGAISPHFPPYPIGPTTIIGRNCSQYDRTPSRISAHTQRHAFLVYINQPTYVAASIEAVL